MVSEAGLPNSVPISRQPARRCFRPAFRRASNDARVLHEISDISDTEIAWRNTLRVAVAVPKDESVTVAVPVGEMLRLSIKNSKVSIC